MSRGGGAQLQHKTLELCVLVLCSLVHGGSAATRHEVATTFALDALNVDSSHGEYVNLRTDLAPADLAHFEERRDGEHVLVGRRDERTDAPELSCLERCELLSALDDHPA